MITRAQGPDSYPIHQPSEVKGAPIEMFRRLVVGTTSPACYIVSPYQVQRLDLRVRARRCILGTTLTAR